MIRSMFMLLLFIIIFLVGMVVGIDRSQMSMVNNLDETIATDDEMTEEAIEIEEIVIEQNDIMEERSSVHFTHKIASILEASIKGFYNIVVEIMYQIASLFY